MRFTELLEFVGNEAVFETGFLLAGDVDAQDVRRQLSRWVRTGKLMQLRRGLYALAPPYRRVDAHPFVVANRLVHGSYVSRQSVLAEHGMIPEAVPTVTSVSMGRPGTRQTPLGRFDYRHVKPTWFIDYTSRPVARNQHAFMATPEKALLDLVYLEPGADSPEALAELRLQSLDTLDLDHLEALAETSGQPKLRRAAERIRRLAERESAESVLV